MTKRALSLLLTLVMVLSLCVPALAAEDFEAEAPAEVVEEAPEAPEAPAAPEAEEPADEPVADEPAAEEAPEAVADEPEMASIMPEDAEDLPYLVAVGVIDKVSHYKLEKALKDAAPYKAKVDAGEMYSDVPGSGKNFVDFDFTKTFDAVYAEAQRNMDGINSQTITGDVSDDSVKKAAANLEAILPDGDGYGTGTPKIKLSDTPSNAMVALMGASGLKTNDTGAIDAILDGSKYPSLGSLTDTDYNNAATNTALVKTIGKNANWTKYFPSDYVDDLKAAITAAGKIDADSTFAEYYEVVELFNALYEDVEDAVTPTSEDAATLTAAAKKAEDAIKAYNDSKATDQTKAELEAKYVDGKTRLGAITQTTVDNARKVLDANTANGFVALKTYKDYTDNLATVELVDSVNSLEIVGQALTAVNPPADKNIKSATVTVSKVTATDGKSYGYSYSVNGVWADLKNGDQKPSETEVKILLTGSEVDGALTKYTTGAILPLKKNASDTTAPTSFDEGDVVIVYFYEQLPVAGNGAPEFSTTVSERHQITLNGDYYAGPVINKDPASVTANSGMGTIGGTSTTGYKGALNAGLDTPAAGNKFTVKVTTNKAFTNADYSSVVNGQVDNKNVVYIVEFAVQSANLDIKDVTVGKRSDMQTNTFHSTGATITITEDDKLTVGEMDVVMRVRTKDGEGPVEHAGGRTQVTIEPLTKYTGTAADGYKDGMAALKDVIKKANKMVETDYKLSTNGKNAGYETVSAAWDKFESVIAAGQTLVDTAATLPNTPTNRDKVNKAVANIVNVSQYFDKLTSSREAFLEALAKARAIKDTGYTYETWGPLQVAIAKYGDPDSDDYITASDPQSVIDAATADLNACMAALAEEGAVNKAPLEAAIASAKALKEADYTAESWAANKATIDDAIKAAEAVVANPNATQAQVNAAQSVLETAVAKLVKVGGEEEPPVNNHPAPASGTGWSYDRVTGEWYFYKNNALVANYWVGKIDGASQWDSNWYYVGADGKMLTGMQYLDDLHGGMGWYFLQPTNTKQEIGKMLTGFQWVGGQYGECYFSKASGSSGKCTWSELLGNWNGTTWVK